MSRKFISSRTDLKPYLLSSVCLFVDGVLEDHCVLPSSYGRNAASLKNTFDIRPGACYGAQCDQDAARIAYNNWIASFF